MMAALSVAGALTATGCEPSSSLFGPGLDMQVRVHDAQLARGEVSDDQGGPIVSQVSRPQPEVARGEGTVILKGRLGPGGVAVHLQAEGDDGRWIIPAKGYDFVIDDELQWSAELEFSYAIQVDELPVRLQASDADGVLGPVTETRFFLSPDVPPARLLVSLGWDAPVDVDLHVVDPSGVTIGAKNINSYEPPPGQVPPPDEWMQGGYLDYDSNQQCQLDLRNRENILWLYADPPPGRYQVYAHLYSACGQSAVNIVGTVQQDGELVTTGNTTLYDFDARVHPAEGETPGLLLLEFDIP